MYLVTAMSYKKLDEKIEWKETIPPKPLELYLLKCQSYSGNSGSRVIFNLLRQQG